MNGNQKTNSSDAKKTDSNLQSDSSPRRLVVVFLCSLGLVLIVVFLFAVVLFFSTPQLELMMEKREKIGRWPAFEPVECREELKGKKCKSMVSSFIDPEISTLFSSEYQTASSIHLSGFRPIRYHLNLTIFRQHPVQFSGSLSLLVRTVVGNSSRLVLHSDSTTVRVDFGSIRIRRCSGRPTPCITMIGYDRTALIINLDENIGKGELIRVDIGSFEGKETTTGGIHSQNFRPASWERWRSWIVGTVFQMRSARKVFPCMDEPSLKARFSLCVSHPENTVSRGNMPTISSLLIRVGASAFIRTCFAETPPMSTYLVTFAVFDQMSELHSMYNSSLSPNIRLLHSDHLPPEQFHWLLKESRFGLSEMAILTNTVYPLDQLTFIISYAPYYGIENFGLVTLQAQWIEYPRYEQAHLILIHEIIHQWVGNLFTIAVWDEICLQEGLTTYFEWTLAEQLPSVETSKLERFHERRRESLRKEQFQSGPIIHDFTHTNQITNWCFGKPPLAFEMLEQGFGTGLIDKFLNQMVTKYSWRNAGLNQWTNTMSEAANDKNAGLLLHRFFTNSGFPLVMVIRTGTLVQISQKTVVAGHRIVDEREPFVLPLEIRDSQGDMHRLVMSQNMTSLDIASESVWILVDPDTRTYSRIIYDVHNYLALLTSCTNGCSISQTQLRTIMGDFCWAFENDHLNVVIEQKTVWSRLLALLALKAEELRLGQDCTCCLRSSAWVDQSTPHSVGCKWIWNDKCVKMKVNVILDRNQALINAS